jgi:hypothetical protein
MAALLLQFAFFVAAIVAAYFFWIRPILRSRPAFAAFYAKAESFWEALRERQGRRAGLRNRGSENSKANSIETQ